MDFDEAVSSHSQWKRKLRNDLAKHDSSLRPVEVALDHKCPLGQWIYGEGSSYSALPEYTKLKYEHARFHTVAADLVNKANCGESIEQDLEPCSSSEFSNASSAVIIAITSMKKRVFS
jgi:hypothetical protein